MLIACGGPRDYTFTDNSANRAQAEALARPYLEQHRSKLLTGGRGVVGKCTINGGSLRRKSARAFEVRLAITGADRAKHVVVYVYDADGLAVAGAQSRDKYEAVLKTLGGKLDRDFKSRD